MILSSAGALIFAASARKAGLVTDTPSDLLEALFKTGISTKEVANEYSGRGIGFGAVKVACERLGGTMKVISTSGQGTQIEMSWPASILTQDPLVSLRTPVSRTSAAMLSA